MLAARRTGLGWIAWWPRFAPLLNVHSRDTHWLGANLGLVACTTPETRSGRQSLGHRPLAPIAFAATCKKSQINLEPSGV
jgi:hypothetical protein